MRVSAFGKTDLGKRRSNNEDDLALVDLSAGRTLPDHAIRELPVGEEGVLLAVCDGVGGRKAGEVASGLALEVLAQEMESIAPSCPKRDLFRAAVEKVNARVWQEASTDPTLKGMATTLTAAVLCQRRAILAHVGDSRAYLLRGEKIRQITRDQSFVQSLIQSGALSEEDALQSPFRNVILQAIGRKTSVEVALDAIDLTSGDLLLLCTDGLSEKVRPEEMAEQLSAGSLSEAVESLIALANERGGEDNITALAARVEDD